MMIVLVLGKKDPMDLLSYRVPRYPPYHLPTYQPSINYLYPPSLTISKKRATTPIMLKDSDSACLPSRYLGVS